MNNPTDPVARAELLTDLAQLYEKFGQNSKAADICAFARFTNLKHLDAVSPLHQDNESP